MGEGGLTLDETRLRELIQGLIDALAAADPQSGVAPLPMAHAEDPLVLSLAAAILRMEQSHAAQLARLEDRFNDRGKELIRAYNAVQEKSESISAQLQSARSIQKRFIPQQADFPSRPELRVAGYYQSMDKVGGDLYDILRCGKNAYGLLIADVSGHGVPASLITALIKVAFQSSSGYFVSPSDTCAQVNSRLLSILQDLCFFVTAFYAVLNLETGSLSYVNAGHNPAILFRPGTQGYELLEPSGPILGVDESAQFETKTITLEPGSRLTLYTDGIVEARDPLGHEFGVESLARSLARSRVLPVGEAVDHAVADLGSFCMSAPLEDDRSVLCLDYLARCQGK
jgi:phosphoserine phosphatase RsbU/P